jgi:hypothetical protein
MDATKPAGINETADATLLAKLNEAVAARIEAEKTAETAKAAAETASAELVSRSKTVGLLLLEAKKLHPRAEDFWQFVKKVQGLGQSRAYDCMRIAGGRTTDEEIRKETRDRVKKHRASKKLQRPTPEKQAAKPDPKPDSVTVTESAEVSIDQRRRENEALDTDDNSAQEQWQRSLGYHAGEAATLPAYWRREFGEWEKFEVPSDLMTLAEQAAETWKKLVADLRAQQSKKARAA